MPVVQPDPDPGERQRRAPGILQGEYHWHKHDEEDECSWCSKESYCSTWREGTIALGKHLVTRCEGSGAPDARADEDHRADVEAATVTPTGD